MKQHTQINHDAFYERLTLEYTDLFVNDPDYAFAASRMSAQDLARKMTNSIAVGTANKDGEVIKRTCRHFGIPHTYKAIRAFLDAQ